MSKNCQYASIRQFGPTQQPNPVAMCLSSSMDRRFQYGGAAGQLSGPRNANCQNYMAQRCAKEWDGFCEYFYKEYGTNGNNRMWPNASSNQIDTSVTPRLTIGEQMLRNTAERKYCTYADCSPICEPLDPTNPASPMVTYYVKTDGSAGPCTPVCTVNPQTIDADPVMNRILDQPTVCASTLLNICNTAKRTGTNLSGTKIGKACDFLLN